MRGNDSIKYQIFDPTGNITALVEDEVGVALQPNVAAAIMRLHQRVEQVGFVSDSGTQPMLRMAGGEFCGNAAMCAAAWHACRIGLTVGSVTLRVSGASELVEVRLKRTDDGGYRASVHMPHARAIEELEMTYGGLRDVVPLVRMEGISHIVIEQTSALWRLRDCRADAEQAVRAWCDSLDVDGLGLMFVEGEGEHRSLVPLVYVPVSGTMFWENSCASGSAAVGRYVAALEGAESSLWLEEPGGTLFVQSQPGDGETWLTGHASKVSAHVIPRRACIA